MFLQIFVVIIIRQHFAPCSVYQVYFLIPTHLNSSPFPLHFCFLYAESFWPYMTVTWKFPRSSRGTYVSPTTLQMARLHVHLCSTQGHFMHTPCDFFLPYQEGRLANWLQVTDPISFIIFYYFLRVPFILTSWIISITFLYLSNFPFSAETRAGWASLRGTDWYYT